MIILYGYIRLRRSKLQFRTFWANIDSISCANYVWFNLSIVTIIIIYIRVYIELYDIWYAKWASAESIILNVIFELVSVKLNVKKSERISKNVRNYCTKTKANWMKRWMLRLNFWCKNHTLILHSSISQDWLLQISHSIYEFHLSFTYIRTLQKMVLVFAKFPFGILLFSSILIKWYKKKTIA